MSSTSRLKKEIIVLVGGTALLFLAATLCGITKTLFATPSSIFGAAILLVACRSLVASLFRPSIAAVRPQNA
jgi:hypothetical protein